MAPMVTNRFSLVTPSHEILLLTSILEGKLGNMRGLNSYTNGEMWEYWWVNRLNRKNSSLFSSSFVHSWPSLNDHANGTPWRKQKLLAGIFSLLSRWGWVLLLTFQCQVNPSHSSLLKSFPSSLPKRPGKLPTKTWLPKAAGLYINNPKVTHLGVIHHRLPKQCCFHIHVSFQCRGETNTRPAVKTHENHTF